MTSPEENGPLLHGHDFALHRFSPSVENICRPSDITPDYDKRNAHPAGDRPLKDCIDTAIQRESDSSII